MKPLGDSQLHDDREKAEILRSMLDAIPAMVMVVDRDFNVYRMNSFAARQLQTKAETGAVRQKGGILLHCVHAREEKGKCPGEEQECTHCMLRNTIRDALQKGRMVQRRTHIIRSFDGALEEALWLVTASPFVHDGDRLAVLVLEDLSRIHEDDAYISICAECKKVRQEDGSWEAFESYFGDRLGVDFSHAICPGCLEKLYPRFADHNGHHDPSSDDPHNT